MTLLDLPILSPVLVVGGNGFVAYHVIGKILEEGTRCTIHSLDIDVSRNRHPGVHYHECDVSSRTAVDQVMEAARPRVVFQCSSPETSHIPDSLYRSVIVDGNRFVLEAARRLGTVRAFIITSSSSVIHDNVSDLVDATEEFPVLRYPQQKRFYSLCKVDAEADVLSANRADPMDSEHHYGGMLTASVRPCGAIGEHDVNSLGKMLGNVFDGRARYQIGKGDNLFDFMYVGNLADAHLLLAYALLRAWNRPPPKDPETRVDGQAFNITDDDPWPFWEFQRTLAAAVGKPIRKEDIVVVPKTVGLVMATISEWVTWALSWGKRTPNMTVEGIMFATITRTFKVDKAKKRLGYRPKVSMQEAIKRGVKWYMEEVRGESVA